MLIRDTIDTYNPKILPQLCNMA